MAPYIKRAPEALRSFDSWTQFSALLVQLTIDRVRAPLHPIRNGSHRFSRTIGPRTARPFTADHLNKCLPPGSFKYVLLPFLPRIPWLTHAAEDTSTAASSSIYTHTQRPIQLSRTNARRLAPHARVAYLLSRLGCIHTPFAHLLVRLKLNHHRLHSYTPRFVYRDRHHPVIMGATP